MANGELVKACLCVKRDGEWQERRDQNQQRKIAKRWNLKKCKFCSFLSLWFFFFISNPNFFISNKIYALLTSPLYNLVIISNNDSLRYLFFVLPFRDYKLISRNLWWFKTWFPSQKKKKKTWFPYINWKEVVWSWSKHSQIHIQSKSCMVQNLFHNSCFELLPITVFNSYPLSFFLSWIHSVESANNRTKSTIMCFYTY